MRDDEAALERLARKQREGRDQRRGNAGGKGADATLYRLAQLKAAAGKRVLMTGSKKDADVAVKLGYVATALAPGSKWRPAFDPLFTGTDVVVVSGRDQYDAEKLAKRLARVAAHVRLLIVPQKDLSKWAAQGGTRAELDVSIALAPELIKPTADDEEEGKEDDDEKAKPPIDDDAEIARLAKMRALDYERARKEAGKKLGITRLALLDALVKAKRLELGLVKGDDDQGEAVTFEDVEPWPSPVDGAQLLDDIAAAIGDHIIMADYERDISALWIIHTYIVRHFMISPKFWVRSAVRRCGKTTLIDVLAHLVNRPWTTGSITKAALFRVIAKWHPTLLIDEVDTFVGDDEELRGMINLSHRYDGSVTRTVGDNHEPRKFPVYAAVALSGIGGLAATLADRSLPVTLRRKKRDEKTKPLRIGKTGHLDELRRRIVRWVADHEQTIAERDPEMPSSLLNREADNWIAALAIADEAGWSQRARKAAEAVHKASAGEEDSDDIVERLLSDCRNILQQRAALIADYNKTAEGKLKPVEKVGITSAALTDSLVTIEDGPWKEWDKNGKPITQGKLARLLKRPGLNIRPEPEPIRTVVKTEDENTGRTWWQDIRARGYLLAAFEDAFARLLPPESSEDARANPKKGDPKCVSVTQPINMGTSDDSKVCQADPSVTLSKSQKPASNGPESHLHTLKGGKPASARSSTPLDDHGPHVEVPDLPPDSRDEHGATVASVPFMITREMRQRLHARGYLPEAIDRISPQQAWDILSHAPGAEPEGAQLCAKCGEQGGNIVSYAGLSTRVHEHCEQEWRNRIDHEMAQRGVWLA